VNIIISSSIDTDDDSDKAVSGKDVSSKSPYFFSAKSSSRSDSTNSVKLLFDNDMEAGLSNNRSPTAPLPSQETSSSTGNGITKKRKYDDEKIFK
jgi:hypothetical protein